MRHGRRRHRAGFTLIEALVALAIVAVVAAMVLKGLGGGLRTAAFADRKAAALTEARSLLAAAGRETALAASRLSGVSAGGFAWEVEIEPYSAPPQDPRIGPRAATDEAFWVRATVRWRGSRGDEAVSLLTLKRGA